MATEKMLLPEDHPTPSLVIDAAIVRNNIGSMQAYCDEHQLKLRPHTKTHKSIHMGREQILAGAAGLTVAKAGEAEIMSQASDDLFIAYPAIGHSRLRRVMKLAKTARLRLGIDSRDAAEIIQAAALQAGVTIGIMVDIDVGFHRTGVMNVDQAVALCEFVDQQSHLQMQGLMCFPGHIKPSSDEGLWRDYEASLQEVIESLERKGIESPTVSGGSTPTAKESHRNKRLNEIRPGTYIYNDWNEVRLGVCGFEDCAARVLATIVSVPKPTKFIVDAGSKALSSDRNAFDPESGFGYVVEYPQAKITRLSEEHGEIVLPIESLETTRQARVGDRVWIIPNHICVCVNLQNEFYLVDDNQLTCLRVDARGMLV